MNKAKEKDLLSTPVTCPVCGSKNISRGHGYSNIYWPDIDAFNELEIICCNSCGFGFSWPELTDTEVEHFYVNDYRKKYSPFHVNFESLTKPFNINVHALSQILLGKQFAPFYDGDCFVDIGPGEGGSFGAAALALTNPECCAIELNAGAASAFKRVYGIQTYTNAKSFIASGKRAKICLMSHSLEHYKLSWLTESLEELKTLLCKDGVLVIEVPLVDMRRHSELRTGDSPHFLFFSIDSIKTLFEKSGWTVLFCNSVADTYADWWKSRTATPSLQQPGKSFNRTIKDILKPSFSILPKTLQNIVKRIAKADSINVSGVQFSYGGDRTCLRLVATPCQKDVQHPVV